MAQNEVGIGVGGMRQVANEEANICKVCVIYVRRSEVQTPWQEMGMLRKKA